MAVRMVADHQWSMRHRRWLTAAEVGGNEQTVRLAGTLLPGLRDHHVHLGLVAAVDLEHSALSAVDDLGWIPAVALDWQRTGVGGCSVRVAGPFLTAPGGYPSGRQWAPPDSVLAISSPAAGRAAVRDLARAGVRIVKVALNGAMPLLDDVTLRALVTTAHEYSLPVVVHAEGEGQPGRALAAGADALAHTPWTERLDDTLVRDLAVGLVVISTLAILSGQEAEEVALDNLARFHRAGGRIRYGTDMGNGPTPVDVNRAEIAGLVSAGLDVADILDAIGRADDTAPPGWTPHGPPDDAAQLPDWLLTVRRHPADGPAEDT